MSPAELERLALVMEEAGEIQQIIGKILRHGYESRWPRETGRTNRDKLKEEMIDLMLAIGLLVNQGDATPMTEQDISEAIVRKNQWLHHNTIPLEFFQDSPDEYDDPEEIA